MRKQRPPAAASTTGQLCTQFVGTAPCGGLDGRMGRGMKFTDWMSYAQGYADGRTDAKRSIFRDTSKKTIYYKSGYSDGKSGRKPAKEVVLA
jgi:hypothetical protein